MKIKLTTALLLLFFWTIVSAQKETFEIETKSSQIIKSSDFDLNFVVKLDENEYLNIFGKKIFKLDNNLAIVKEVVLPTKYLKNEIEYVSLQKVGEVYNAYFTLYESKKDEISLYQIAIDENTLNWKDEPILIGSIYQKKGNKYNEALFNFSKSKNQKLLLISGLHASKAMDGLNAKLAVSKGEKSLGEISCSFWVFDENQQLINSKNNFIINRGLSISEFKDFVCDNVGNVAMNVYDITIKDILDKEKVNASQLLGHRLYFFDLKGNVKEFKTDKNIRLGSSIISYPPNNEYLDFVSIALSNSDYTAGIGTYSLRIKISDWSTEFININYFEASDFLDKSALAKLDKNAVFEVDGLKNMLDVIYSEDGNMHAIMEKRAFQIGLENNPSVYTYSDIVIIYNLNIEVDKIHPFIIKRGLTKTFYIEKGAGILYNMENLIIWSGYYVYKIDLKDKSLKKSEVVESDFENTLKKRKGALALMENRMPNKYILINNTSGIAMGKVAGNNIIKSINISGKK